MKSIVFIATMLVMLGLQIAFGATPPEAALLKLQDGNAHFVAGQSSVQCATASVRESLVEGQHPFACVVTCSDSRVPPELLFDQSLGQLFVVRVAGNVISPEVVGSVEYAVEHLHTPLVVVLGHSGCGAVSAALGDTPPEGAVNTLLNRIRPAIEAVKGKGYPESELAAATVREHARRGAEELIDDSRALDDAVAHGELMVLSAVYDLHSGEVAWQTQLCTPPARPIPAPATAAVAKPVPPVPPPPALIAKAAPPEEPAKDVPTQRIEPSSSYARRHR
jgi:carbonic anhydrase